MGELKTHEYDPNYSTSTALVEVRTLLSRARTALEVLDGNPEFQTKQGQWRNGEFAGEELIPHPELEQMKDVLRKTVAGLAHWERRGSRKGA